MNNIMYLYNYVGRKLYGYCNGYFGRDSYEDKRIVYAGLNYIIVEHEDDNNTPGLAYFYEESREQVEKLLKEWMNPENNN